MKRAVFVVLMALVSCGEPIDDGGIAKSPRAARADKRIAKVGEPVEVSLTTGYVVYPDSRFSEVLITDLKLGGCFWQDDGGIDMVVGGLCGVGERPLQNWVSISGGSAATKALGDVTLKRGETREFTHTFTFTSTEPGVVAVSAGTQESVPEEDRLISGMSGSIRITFE